MDLDQVGPRMLPAAGLGRRCGTGSVTRRVSMKGFTFEMILFSRAFWCENTVPNYCRGLWMEFPESTVF